MSDFREEKYAEIANDAITRLHLYARGMRELAVQAGSSADSWQQIAAQHCRNEQYYHGLLIQIGEALGSAVMTCDDGTVSPDVLVAKVPEVALARIAELEKQIATARQEAFEQMAQYWESRGCKTEAREARRMAKELWL